MTISTIPAVYYEWAFNAIASGSTIPPWWTDVSSRVQMPWSTARGRQYELDVNETGEWHAILANADGAFNPANKSSPFVTANPNNVVDLFRRARIRMPLAPTQNLLPRNVATGSATMNQATDSVANWWYISGAGSIAQGLYLSAAPSGQTTALAWTTPVGTTSVNNQLYGGAVSATAAAARSFLVPVEDNFQVAAGTTYTASVYFSRLASADATVQVKVGIIWYGVGGTALSTSTGAAVTVPTVTSWARGTVTAAAPAGAAWGRLIVSITSPASTTATNTIYATGWQVEAAGSATSWADPGVTAFLFSGFDERLPQVFTEMGGLYPSCEPVILDAFGLLATTTLQAPFVNEVLALGPNFLYQLNEPAGATACIDSAGNRIPAPVESSPYGVGSLVFGSSVTATNPTLAFLGTAGPVATLNNDASLLSPTHHATFVSIHKTTNFPGPPSSGPWTRMVAFRTTVVPDINHRYTMWWSATPTTGTNAQLFIQVDNNATGTVTAGFTDNAGHGNVSQSPGGVCDGNWHLIAIGVDPGTGAGTVWLDGAVLGTATGMGSGSGFTSDVLGCVATLQYQEFDDGFAGDLAFAMEFPALLTNAQMTNLYNSWRSASSGESSGSRYARVLTWAGWTGPTAIDAGSTQSMGPATDLTGTTALDALNSIALTENGDQYASAAGVMTFKARSARYNARTPVYTFGEGPPVGGAGEWPCELTRFDYDPSHLANRVQVTQYQGQTFQVVNPSSATRYGQRTYQRQINASSDAEVQDAAKYLLAQLSSPHLRPEAFILHPSAVPGLMAVCAQLEKGLRIRLIKRPNGSPSITTDCFVERIEWQWDPDTGDVFVTVQASPADLANYGVLAAMHTTLNLQAASGQNKATINGLPDAAVNALVSSLPSGYSLRFEPGTPRDETLALAAGGIPSTSPGWTSAQLTFASNFSFTHAAGTTVCEPLPAGYTDPTTWDASAVTGASYTTVVSGGASGTNTITVGPLQDSAVNGLSQTWSGGDTIWLSPGTANFETAVIKSVPAVVPGYASATLTLTANLAHSHTAGDFVCDPLPAGVTDPTTLTPTLRLAY